MGPDSIEAVAEADPSAALDPADLAACLRVLEQLRESPSLADAAPALGRAVSGAYKGVRRDRRKQTERDRRRADRALVETTGRCRAEARPAELASVSLPPPPADGLLTKWRTCYVCQTGYRRLDPFYHLLCPACAAENHHRRHRRADLTGRRAVVTGGRIKIGYQLVLKLLRDGAAVHVTTRFPKDAARRYAAEPGFADWAGRLRIHPLDLRDVRAVVAFAEHLGQSVGSIDILVNNAAQTIRREPAYFANLYAAEAEPISALPPVARTLLADTPAVTTPPASHPTVPELWNWPDDLPYDAAGRPRDARARNSWLLEMAEVDPAEAAEAMVVNALAPFVLCGRLEPLLRRSPFPDRYVVNVSAMEGQFDRAGKTPRHPHTNMAKAALNMLTRTSAARCAEQGVHMNSVDTGWVTEENPHPKRARIRVHGFVPPLDETDGAARVYDPILRGVADGAPVFGLFLKNYRPVAW